MVAAPWKGGDGQDGCMGKDMKEISGEIECFIGEGNGNPLQDYCLDNFMYKGASQAIVYGVTESQIWLSS